MPETKKISVTRGETWDDHTENPASRQPRGCTAERSYKTSSLYSLTAPQRDKRGVLHQVGEPVQYVRTINAGGGKYYHVVTTREGTQLAVEDADWVAEAPLGPVIGRDKPTVKKIEPNFAKFDGSGPTEMQRARDALAHRHLTDCGYFQTTAPPGQVWSYLHGEGHKVEIKHDKAGGWRATHTSLRGDVKHFTDTDALEEHLAELHRAGTEEFAGLKIGKPIAPGVVWVDD
jgi:hypothetical protein